MEEDQAGSNPRQTHVVQAGPNPKPMHKDFFATVDPQVHQSLKLTMEEYVHIENPPSSSRTLSSMKNLVDAFTFGDQFFNDKSSKDEPGKTNVETKVESIVTVPIHQAPSSAPPLSTPIIDLTPPKPEKTTQDLSSRVYTLENHHLDLSEFEMKEILHDRMFESGFYISHPEHTALYDALEISMDRENKEEFKETTAKSRKRHCNDQDPPPPPPKDSDQSKKKRHDSDASALKQPPPVDDVPIPDDVHLSESKDIGAAYLPKIKTRPNWLKPVPEEDIPKTPEPD
ncbi:hypothetical protein Tco_1229896 [Tanacetum coccineum]